MRYKNMIRPATFLLAIVAIGLLLGGCGKSKHVSERKGYQPVVFTDAELAEGFVVTMLRGSNVIRIEDGVVLGRPPYDFYITLTNPEDSPKQVLLTSSPPVDLKITKDEAEIFRYSTKRHPRAKQSTVEIEKRGKKSWNLKWNGLLDNNSYPPDGSYTLILTLNSEPVFELVAEGVQLSFPSVEEDDEEETGEEDDNIPGIVIIPGMGKGGR